MTGIELIVVEREEQITKHGHTVKNDAKYDSGELLMLAKFMLLDDSDAEKDDLAEILEEHHGFKEDFLNKLNSKSYQKRLAIAGAFIAAEIDRVSTEKEKP